MGDYSNAFTPPAPMAIARITAPDASADAKQVEVPMLFDTGSDVSLLPPSALTRLGLGFSERFVEVESFDSQRSTRPIVQATMHLEKYKITVDFVLHDEGTTVGIVGRNVLNLLRLTLDGPRLIWMISP